MGQSQKSLSCSVPYKFTGETQKTIHNYKFLIKIIMHYAFLIMH